MECKESKAPTCVEMAIEMDNSHRTIGPVDGSQQRKGNGMITTQGDHPGEGLAEQGRTLLLGICLRCS